MRVSKETSYLFPRFVHAKAWATQNQVGHPPAADAGVADRALVRRLDAVQHVITEVLAAGGVMVTRLPVFDVDHVAVVLAVGVVVVVSSRRRASLASLFPLSKER